MLNTQNRRQKEKKWENIKSIDLRFSGTGRKCMEFCIVR